MKRGKKIDMIDIHEGAQKHKIELRLDREKVDFFECVGELLTLATDDTGNAREHVTVQHDIVLEIGETFTHCLCGGHVRLLRNHDGELMVEHQNGRSNCIHRNAIVLGLTQLIGSDNVKN